MSHDKKLRLLLGSIKAAVAEATTLDQLITAIDQAAKFDGPIEFDNVVSEGVLLCSIFIFGFLGIFALLGAGDYQLLLYVSMATVLIVALTAFFVGKSRTNDIAKLSDEILKRKSFIDNDLADKPVDSKAYAKFLESHFREFKRGNHSRDIKSVVCGRYSGEIHSFDFEHYHFRYVQSRTETRSVSDGKGGTRMESRTVYDTYNRYGIILDYGMATSVAVTGYSTRIKGLKYRPASIEFNKTFTVRAGSELDAARFLKPAVVVLIEELSKSFSNLNLEINAESALCISFKNDDLLKIERQFGIENPHKFIEEIRPRLSIHQLDTLLTFIHDLMRLTDSNFGAYKS